MSAIVTIPTTKPAPNATAVAVTLARKTQIINLPNPAGDIQEALLFLPRSRTARTPLRSGSCGHWRGRQFGSNNGH